MSLWSRSCRGSKYRWRCYRNGQPTWYDRTINLIPLMPSSAAWRASHSLSKLGINQSFVFWEEPYLRKRAETWLLRSYVRFSCISNLLIVWASGYTQSAASRDTAWGRSEMSYTSYWSILIHKVIIHVVRTSWISYPFHLTTYTSFLSTSYSS